MKLLSARLHGLYGICRGSGKEEIFIDFTKCQHDMILITGPNGSGKSTIINVLHPFPDDLSMYMDKKPGFKEIEYILNDSTVYKIRIDYPINDQGKRLTTKAHLFKYVSGEFCDLNPNGNVGSFKSCLSEEFKLDPSFLALSLLSTEDKGLVEKTPAERKKYVGAILESTVTYNDMYKVLNKRSSIFNSMINSIVAKIDSIGDIEFINSTIKSTKDRIDTLEANKAIKVKQLASAEAIVNLSDPSGTIRDNYSNLISLKASVEDKLERVKSVLDKYRGSNLGLHTFSLINCESEINKLNTEIETKNKDIEYITKEIDRLQINRARDESDLNAKKGKLTSLSLDSSYEAICKSIEEIQDKIYNYNLELSKYKIPVGNITTEELVSVINTMEFIKNTVTRIKSNTIESIFQLAVDSIITNTDMNKNTVYLQKVLSDYQDRLRDLKEQVIKIEAMVDATRVLSSRPKTCTDNTCPFIANAIEYQKQNPEKILDELGEQIKEVESNIDKQKNAIEYNNEMIGIYNELCNLVSYVKGNFTILNKFSDVLRFNDINTFLQLIVRSDINLFGDNLTEFSDQIYILDDKSQLEKSLQDLEKNKVLYETQSEIIKDMQDDIQKLSKSLEETDSSIIELVNRRIELLSSIEDIQNRLSSLKTAGERLKELETLEEQNSNIDSQLIQMETTISNIEQSVKDANIINSEIISIDNEINPLKDKLNELNFSLNKWYEYNEELKQYNAKADMIDLLKRYTSPTKDGIQNLFIKVYMGQTLAIANNLLQRMFGGELALTDYIINDKEFRIPCMSMDSPIINDDISSCSFAQKCMISMILSFVLLNQSSTIYNIPRLDEVDAGLDQENRSNFIPLVRQIMDIFNMQQCIMISHASESVLSDVDIIMLGKVNNETPKGNIIFTY